MIEPNTFKTTSSSTEHIRTRGDEGGEHPHVPDRLEIRIMMTRFSILERANGQNRCIRMYVCIYSCMYVCAELNWLTSCIIPEGPQSVSSIPAKFAMVECLHKPCPEETAANLRRVLAIYNGWLITTIAADNPGEFYLANHDVFQVFFLI